MRVSEIGLGTWGLSGAYGALTDELFRDTLHAARDGGVDVFDLAPLWGRSEEMVGEFFEGARDAITFVTRAGVVLEGDQVVERFESEALRKDCEESLRRLRTDRIDVWLLHQPSEEVLLRDDVYELALKLKEEGKIRAWGVSMRTVDEARVAMARGCEVLCVRYNLLYSDDLKDLETELEANGCGVLVRSPLMHGLLSGRWTEYRQFAATDHRKHRWSSRALGVRVQHVNRLRYLVHDGITNMASASLRYVLSHGRVACAMLGARRPIQIKTIGTEVGEPPYLPQADLDRLQAVLAEAGA